MGKIRVLVVDDHKYVRYGLKIALGIFDAIEFIGEASNGLEAIDLCNQLRPDVVLMDLSMPEMDGISATRQIHQMHPEIRIIALTAAAEERLIETVLRAGAAGFLMKNSSVDDVANTIIKTAKAS
ncbi:MAG: response regulator transcription factor [Anaerolineae bacterium]